MNSWIRSNSAAAFTGTAGAVFDAGTDAKADAVEAGAARTAGPRRP